jgi:phospholipid/cholesterol/gamma-HCH transport system substrate-binding protein
MASQSDNIESIMENAKELTSALAANTGNIDSILTNFTTLSSNLSALELEPLLTSAETSLAEINKLLAALNDAEGTMGKIIYEDGLYEGLDSTLISINALINDLKANPKKYVSFSLIERKEKSKD